MGSGALYGSKAEVVAAEREVRMTLQKVPGLMVLHFFNEKKLARVKKLLRVAGWLGLGRALRKRLGKMETAFKLLQGISPENCVQGSLWRVKNTGPIAAKQSPDPLDYRAGIIWLAPVVPMTREHVEKLNSLLEPIFNRHGFDYQATLSMVTARALCAVTTIAFDTDLPDEARSARECHAECLEALLNAGYPPYRAGWMTMDSIWKHSSNFFDVASKIKAALDPQGILSPCHYVP
jgi:4-cresol dehydrogenase (hydroxylating)